jgi:hypothetical protein
MNITLKPVYLRLRKERGIEAMLEGIGVSERSAAFISRFPFRIYFACGLLRVR